jgi:hypothetical protein
MRTIFSLSLAVLLAVAGTAAAQTAGLDGSASPALPPPYPGGTLPPPEPLPLAPAEVPPAADTGTTVDLQSPSKCQFCNKIWVDADYLMWWTRSKSLPPLLTQGAATDLNPGALGQPGTTVLFGGGDVDTGMHSGGRVRGGYWFGDDHIFGGDDSFFYLFPNTSTYANSSGGNTLLAVPYTNVLTNLPASAVLAIPGQSAVTYTAAVKDNVLGGDTNLRLAVVRNSYLQVCALAGLRYLQVNEALNITTDVTSPTTVSPGQGVGLVSYSVFNSKNEFYGGQLGGDMSFCHNGFTLDLGAKLALGWTHEQATIDGSSVVNVPGVHPVSYAATALALPTNIGNYTRNPFTFVPEGNLTLGYQFTSHIRATVGYTFIYTTHAILPGDLIDTGINPTVAARALLQTPVVGPSRPLFPNSDSTFWVQGATAGLEFRY